MRKKVIHVGWDPWMSSVQPVQSNINYSMLLRVKERDPTTFLSPFSTVW